MAVEADERARALSLKGGLEVAHGARRLVEGDLPLRDSKRPRGKRLRPNAILAESEDERRIDDRAQGDRPAARRGDAGEEVPGSNRHDLRAVVRLHLEPVERRVLLEVGDRDPRLDGPAHRFEKPVEHPIRNDEGQPVEDLEGTRHARVVRDGDDAGQGGDGFVGNREILNARLEAQPAMGFFQDELVHPDAHPPPRRLAVWLRMGEPEGLIDFAAAAGEFQKGAEAVERDRPVGAVRRQEFHDRVFLVLNAEPGDRLPPVDVKHPHRHPPQPGDSREETREGPGVGIALDEAFVVPEPVRRHDVLL